MSLIQEQYQTFQYWQDLLITTYCKKFPEAKKEMEKCLHYHDDVINRHHVEDSLWTHTMMVCTASKCKYGDKLIPLYECFSEIMITLLHDYGKIAARYIGEDDNKSHFKGHSYKSVTHAYEVILTFIKEFKLSLSFYYLIETILFTISRHMDYENVKSVEQLSKFSNYNNDFYFEMKKFTYSDFAGRITDNSREWEGRDRYLELTKDLDRINTHRDIKSSQGNKHTFNIFCGLPGSGKNYYADKKSKSSKVRTIMLSFDDLRVEYYESSSIQEPKTLNYNSLYKEAFKYCNDNNVDINNILQKRLKRIKYDMSINYVEEIEISISNTNLNKKNRTSLINIIKQNFPDAFINVYFIIATKQYCVNNDLNRLNNNDKSVGENVITQLDNIVFPTFEEKMDRLYMIYPEINWMTKDNRYEIFPISFET